ncbi:hypothetical protein N9M86_04985 [Euryarchaeota archaeon]|nr:hypothetical protein [Euryarchaeota archaeon]MDA9156427.1 hypothetical protein [Candidatus Poseidoniaceae archaeon]
MARQNRKFTPRQRTTRPLGSPLTTNLPPAQPLAPPYQKDGEWYIEPPLSSRLYQKSAIGYMLSDESIRVSTEEILFCHWHRHLPLPSDSWFEEAVEKDPNVIARSILFDTARSGGELLIPAQNIPSKWNIEIHSATWALRWNREQIFSKEMPVAHVRWAWTTDEIDWMEMVEWTSWVHEQGMLAEFLVIDEEMDVTMYLLSQVEPSGHQQLWASFSNSERVQIADMWGTRIPRGDGWYIPNATNWHWDSIGVEHLSGRHLRHEEGQLVQASIDEVQLDSNFDLYTDLVGRGVLLRPGFKYGSRWRVYETPVGYAHAPWLIQPHEDAPRTWEAACLAVRLSEGVHKMWLCALPFHDRWFYLHMQRWLPGRN